MSHLPYQANLALDGLAGSIGIPQDQARMILSVVAAIPLGEMHKRLGSTSLKHFWSFAWGLFLAWFTVGHDALHVAAVSILIYYSALFLPRHAMPYLISAVLIAYLSAFHIWRLYADYLGWGMDVTLIQMIFIVKASTFAFNWHDGQALNHGETLHPKPHLHEHYKQRALTELPSLLEYLSYIWSFAGVLTGPCFECKEYLDFTSGKLFEQFGFTAQKPPSTIKPAMLCVLKAVACYPFVFVHGMLPIIGFVSTDKYFAMPFFNRFAYFWITMTCSRFKYYFAWYLSEAGCIAEGFGLSGRNKDGQLEWNRCSNVSALTVETSYSMPMITNNWNTGVNNWLKYYIYLRVNPPRSVTRIIPAKSLANLITKLTSAFWHGFYPAYYLFFLGAYVANEMDEAMRAHIQARINPNNKFGQQLYKIFGWVAIMFCMNTLGMAFMLLEIHTSIAFWGSLGYSVFWIPIVVIVLCKVLLPIRRNKKPSDKQVHAETTTKEAEKEPTKKEL